MLSRNIHHFNRAFLRSSMDENRRGGRFRTSSVHSSLGQVIDLSHCGAMILKRRFRKPPNSPVFSIRVFYEDFEVLVNARLVRESKQKGVGHLLGLEFIDVTEEQREAIKNIIRNSRCWEVFGEQPADDHTEAA